MALKGFLYMNLYSCFWTQVSLNNQFSMTRSPTAEVHGTWRMTAVHLYPRQQKEYLFIQFVPHHLWCLNALFFSQAAGSLAVQHHKLRMPPVHRGYCSCLTYSWYVFGYTVTQLQKEEQQSSFLHSASMSVKPVIKPRLGKMWVQIQRGWGGLMTQVLQFFSRSLSHLLARLGLFSLLSPKRAEKAAFLLQSTWESEARHYQQPS